MKLLYIYPQQYYKRRYNGLLHAYLPDALKKECDLRLWSEGNPYRKRERGLREIVNLTCPDGNPDCIVFGNIKHLKKTMSIIPDKVNIPKVFTVCDMIDNSDMKKARQFQKKFNCNGLIGNCFCNIQRLKEYNLELPFLELSHGIFPSFFLERQVKKKYDAILLGSLGSVYPNRQLVLDFMRRYQAQFLFFCFGQNEAKTEFTKKEISHLKLRPINKGQIPYLLRSYMSFPTSSIFELVLGKFYECAMAGTAMAIKPFEELIKKGFVANEHFLPLESYDAEYLKDFVKKQLKNKNELINIGKRAQHFVLDNHTIDHRAETLINWIKTSIIHSHSKREIKKKMSLKICFASIADPCVDFYIRNNESLQDLSYRYPFIVCCSNGAEEAFSNYGSRLSTIKLNKNYPVYKLRYLRREVLRREFDIMIFCDMDLVVFELDKLIAEARQIKDSKTIVGWKKRNRDGGFYIRGGCYIMTKKLIQEVVKHDSYFVQKKGADLVLGKVVKKIKDTKVVNKRLFQTTFGFWTKKNFTWHSKSKKEHKKTKSFCLNNSYYNFLKNKKSRNCKKILIDCGSHDGQSTVELDKQFGPFDIIYAFECNPVFEKKYDSLNFRGEFHFYKKAVWINKARLPFYVNKNNNEVGSTLYKDKKAKKPYKKIIVKTIDFHRWFRKTCCKDDFIVVRMDIEGAEYEIINKLHDNRKLSWINLLLIEFHTKKIPSLQGKEEKLVEKINSSNLTWIQL